ncbi:MAG: DNA polymerase III subunit epsilon [Rhizobiaceae bacterium]|nr:DNA polymerase III subunit epsilon [Rhizobiaceae bacterium]
MREIIFDTETTGLYPDSGDRIIEIGAIELVNRFPTGEMFHEYIHPGDREIHPDAERIHGISLEKLKGKPSFEEILPKFQDFFSEGTLIAHNAKFDVGFFDAELARLKQSPIDTTRVVDTLAIARRKFPGARNSLDALCDRFGISRASRTLHGALLDSELLADVYIELTGGRQVGMSLEIATDAEPDSQNLAEDTATAGRQRPHPLPQRLTEVEISAHDALIKTLGDKAIWSKYSS